MVRKLNRILPVTKTEEQIWSYFYLRVNNKGEQKQDKVRFEKPILKFCRGAGAQMNNNNLHFQIPYARSQVHLMELSDQICKNFEDYAQVS